MFAYFSIMISFFSFSILLIWPLSSKLGASSGKYHVEMLLKWLFFFFFFFFFCPYHDGNNFNLVFDLCGDIDLNYK
jgi:hypothetical protein